MADLEQESEKIWDKWRKNKFSHDEVQTELDRLFNRFKISDFFERLENEISNRVHDKIPMSSGYRTSIDRCFSQRASVETEIVKQSDFISFWLNASWLEKPSRDDKKTIKKLDVESLTKYFVLIFRCLIDLGKNGYEDSEQCRKLHAYYKLLNERMLKEGILKVKGDAFDEFLQHKQSYRSQQEKLEQARKSGSFCPNCQSTNVRSYNKAEWKCHTCGKRFRKH